MKSSRRYPLLAILALCVAAFAIPAMASPQQASPQQAALHEVRAGHADADAIPSPEEFFGFSMGTAQELARWDRIVEYFELIDAATDRVQVTVVGDTTLGNPFLSVAISSPGNMAQLDRHRARAHRLARGHGLNEAAATALATEGPSISMIHHNIHSTEIAASQTSVQLVYELATGTDAETLEILDGTITVLLPSGNPDGQMMVVDWYEETLGTDFEEAGMPWLYHHYAGHDNNRDFFFGSLPETRHWFSQVFDVWQPQVYLDQHQMGSTGPRMFVPPFPDPQSPDIPPLMYQEIRLLGGAIATDLAAQDKAGVLTGAMYRIYGQEGALNGRFHGIVSLLTETASARIASDVEVTREELDRAARRMGQPYEFSVAFVDPWPAGTWRLQDIVDYQMIAARSFLKQAARYADDFQLNRWRMAQDSIADAAEEGPYAWLVQLDQSDPLAAADMVERLRWQGIEIYRAGDRFAAIPAPAVDPWAPPVPEPVEEEEGEAEEGEAEDAEEEPAGEADRDGEHPEEHEDGEHAEGEEHGHDEDGEHAEAEAMAPEPVAYPAGTYIIPGGQTGRAALIDVLEVRAPDPTRMWPEGPYLRRYDSAAYTMPQMLGVDVVRVDEQFDAELEPLDGPALPADPGPVPMATRVYVLDAAITRSYEAVNRLLAAGASVSRAAGPVNVGGRELAPGAFLVKATPEAHETLAAISAEMRLPVAVDPDDRVRSLAIAPARVGLFKPWQPSMDEGWSRYVLEDFDFPYESIGNDAVRAGDLGASFDVIILPAQMSLETLIEGRDAEETPEEYAGGIGEEGVEALREFVNSGGTLLTFERADAFALEKLELPVRDALADLDQREFFYSASLVNLQVDTDSPLGWGMKADAAGFFGGGRAYEPTDWMAAGDSVNVVASYAPEGKVLASGLMVGDDHLAGKGAVLEVKMGDGRVVMYGFRVQHRAQTHGTYKLLFNALYEGH
jgi:hypothetical protein